MDSESTPLAADASRPTQHGLLLCWGHFAQELGLLDHWQALPIPQKTVLHAPAAQLTTSLSVVQLAGQSLREGRFSDLAG